MHKLMIWTDPDYTEVLSPEINADLMAHMAAEIQIDTSGGDYLYFATPYIANAMTNFDPMIDFKSKAIFFEPHELPLKELKRISIDGEVVWTKEGGLN